MKEFREFIQRGNVIDLAVAVIIGAAFGAIVTSLTQDIIMPILGLFTGGVDFSNWFISLDGNSYATLAAAQEAGAATVNFGVFISAILNFAIISYAVYLLVSSINRFKKEEEATPPAPPEPTAEEKLLAEIRDLLASRTEV